jgi:small nuclear ribonucleoprotein B and B'
MLSLINWRLKVTINDGRAFIGQMLAFDRHMNLVLADCEEFRRVRLKKKPGESEAGPEQELKRSLGLVILRGETVVSLSVEGPPPVQDEDKKSAVCATLFFFPVPGFAGTPSHSLNSFFSTHSQLPAGPGRGMPAGRGMGMVPPCACFCVVALEIFNRERLFTYPCNNLRA